MIPTIATSGQLVEEESSLINSYYKVVGQIWHSYVILQSNDGIYYIDQHALAERINFEKMRKDAKNNKLTPSPLLQPFSVSIAGNVLLEDKCETLNAL